SVDPQPFVQLPVADVDRDDVSRAVLEQAVGEAAGGRTRVERALPPDVDRESLEGGRELEATATDESGSVARDVERIIRVHESRALVRGRARHRHAAGRDLLARPLPARREPSADELRVEPATRG